MTDKQLQTLRERLADDPTFDPADYISGPNQKVVDKYQCDLCKTRYAPNGICGYCRGHVKMIRAKKAKVQHGG